MLTVKYNKVSRSKVLVERKTLLALIRAARVTETVEIEEDKTDIPIEGIMNLAMQGKSFDFLYDSREDIYTAP